MCRWTGRLPQIHAERKRVKEIDTEKKKFYILEGLAVTNIRASNVRKNDSKKKGIVRNSDQHRMIHTHTLRSLIHSLTTTTGDGKNSIPMDGCAKQSGKSSPSHQNNRGAGTHTLKKRHRKFK